jgi:hypothetical protein
LKSKIEMNNNQTYFNNNFNKLIFMNLYSLIINRWVQVIVLFHLKSRLWQRSKKNLTYKLFTAGHEEGFHKPIMLPRLSELFSLKSKSTNILLEKHQILLSSTKDKSFLIRGEAMANSKVKNLLNLSPS